MLRLIGCGVLALVVSCGGGRAGTKANEPVANAATPAESTTGSTETSEPANASEAVAKAQRDAAEAIARLEELERAMAEMIGSVNNAIAAVDAAQDDADRQAAKSKLLELQRAQEAMQQKIGEAKAKAVRAERANKGSVPKECRDNPLAKGCS